jgi:hypothetical protein
MCRRAFAAAVLAAVFGLAACSGPPPPRSPKPLSPPSGPTLHGRLVLQTRDFIVWAVGENGGKVDASVLAQGSGPAALSPDGRTLAYYTDYTLVFKDIATGAERRPDLRVGGIPVVPGKDCLRWSPDSTRVLYLDNQGALDVTTPAGQALQVDKPQLGSYTQSGGALPAVPLPGPVSIPSQLTCGAWLDPNRIVFDRRTGAMPQTVVGKAAPPDTTTVAVLGESVQLVDSADRWSLVGACGTRLLTTSTSGSDSPTYLVGNLATRAATQAGAATPKGSELTVPGGQVSAAFVPGSCAVVLVDRDGDAQGRFPTYRLDPGATTPVPGKPLRQEETFDPSSTAWSPDPDPTVFADFPEGGGTPRLFDLSTGGVTAVKLPDGPNSSGPRALLGWLP